MIEKLKKYIKRSRYDLCVELLEKSNHKDKESQLLLLSSYYLLNKEKKIQKLTMNIHFDYGLRSIAIALHNSLDNKIIDTKRIVDFYKTQDNSIVNCKVILKLMRQNLVNKIQMDLMLLNLDVLDLNYDEYLYEEISNHVALKEYALAKIGSITLDSMYPNSKWTILVREMIQGLEKKNINNQDVKTFTELSKKELNKGLRKQHDKFIRLVPVSKAMIQEIDLYVSKSEYKNAIEFVEKANKNHEKISNVNYEEMYIMLASLYFIVADLNKLESLKEQKGATETLKQLIPMLIDILMGNKIYCEWTSDYYNELRDSILYSKLILNIAVRKRISPLIDYKTDPINNNFPDKLNNLELNHLSKLEILGMAEDELQYEKLNVGWVTDSELDANLETEKLRARYPNSIWFKKKDDNDFDKKKDDKLSKSKKNDCKNRPNNNKTNTKATTKNINEKKFNVNLEKNYEDDYQKTGNFKKYQKKANSNYPMSLLDTFVGMKPLKNQLRKLCSQIEYDRDRFIIQGIERESKIGLNYIFEGNPGTGKTSAARVIGEILHHYKIIKKPTVIETDRAGLVGRVVGETAIKTQKVIDSALGGVLFIDEAYTLFKEGSKVDFGIESIETILKAMEDKRGEICFIFTGYRKEMYEFQNANPGLRDRINYTINFPDYTNDELLEIGYRIAKSDYFLGMTNDAEKALIRKIDMKRIDETFGNARVVRNLMEEAYSEKSLKASERAFRKEDNINFEAHDFGVLDTRSEDDLYNEAMYKLDSIIGQNALKEEIRRKVSYAKYSVMKQKKHGIISNINNHIIFTGNPGTGKTTFARIIGELYKNIGILKRGSFIETKASDFISPLVGGTREKTQRILKSSLGNVLFIDEAYSLINGGTEAIEEILKFMEDNNDNFILILAGYDAEMSALLNSNTGLKSRINTHIKFNDYNADELERIFYTFVEKDKMTVGKSAVQALKFVIKNIFNNKDENFGNAREMRNLFENIIQYQSLRVIENGLNEEDIDLIEIEDIEMISRKLRAVS